MIQRETHGLVEKDEEINAIVEAVEDIDGEKFVSLSTGGDIFSLSSDTMFEGIEVVSEGILHSSNNAFEASATVYVTLRYGGRRDEVSIPDSYPAVVRGTINNNNVKITEIDVDVGSFYE